MSLARELEELERERDLELRKLNTALHHARRNLKRSLAPSRIIRKHLGASLGIAILAGYLLAPQPRSAAPASPSYFSRIVRLLKPFFAKYFPALAVLESTPAPNDAPPPQNPSPLKSTLIAALLSNLGTILQHKKEIQQVITEIVSHFQKPADPAPQPQVTETEPAPTPDPNFSI